MYVSVHVYAERQFVDGKKRRGVSTTVTANEAVRVDDATAKTANLDESDDNLDDDDEDQAHSALGTHVPEPVEESVTNPTSGNPASEATAHIAHAPANIAKNMATNPAPEPVAKRAAKRAATDTVTRDSDSDADVDRGTPMLSKPASSAIFKKAAAASNESGVATSSTSSTGTTRGRTRVPSTDKGVVDDVVATPPRDNSACFTTAYIGRRRKGCDGGGSGEGGLVIESVM